MLSPVLRRPRDARCAPQRTKALLVLAIVSRPSLSHPRAAALWPRMRNLKVRAPGLYGACRDMQGQPRICQPPNPSRSRSSRSSRATLGGGGGGGSAVLHPPPPSPQAVQGRGGHRCPWVVSRHPDWSRSCLTFHTPWASPDHRPSLCLGVPRAASSGRTEAGANVSSTGLSACATMCHVCHRVYISCVSMGGKEAVRVARSDPGTTDSASSAVTGSWARPTPVLGRNREAGSRPGHSPGKGLSPVTWPRPFACPE